MALPNALAFPMRIRAGRSLAVAAFAAFLLGGAAPALAHDDDAEDLLRAIKRSKLVDLSHPWENDVAGRGREPALLFHA